MRNNHRFALLFIAVCLISSAAFAGGPLILRAPGQPYLWGNGGRNIPFNPDQGGLGPMNNAAAVAQTTASFAAWQAVVSATATHVNAGALPVDVDETNFIPWLEPAAPDGLSAIVYDEDGAIFDLLFGPDSGVLGFAGPEWVNTVTGQITEGVSFLNGGSLVGPFAFPIAEFLSVQVHEYGHYQNLAHTVVNGQIIAGPDSTGPTPNNTFPPPPSFAGRIETMYPFLFIGGGQATPHPDDIAIFSHLYPEPTFAGTTARISGNILAPNGTLPVAGVNVIARNILNPYDDAVSAISGDFTDVFSGPLAGQYTLRGLRPGANYAVYVDTILLGGFSTPPRDPLPGPEEFYNGAAESNSSATDSPNMFTNVSALAGGTAANINIIFNRLAPGPIPAGDDTTNEIFPSFSFEYCGTKYDSFWVNSNGNVSFGAGNTDFSETTAEMLTGPPRIAPMWDDLDATAGGTVSWSENKDSVTIRWTNVPQFLIPGGNTFSLTLNKSNGGGDDDDDDGNHDGDDDDEGDDDDDGGNAGEFKIVYGFLTSTGGLAGYSCGGRITSGFELEQNFSAAMSHTINGREEPAIFEAFTAADNDLDNRTAEFRGPEDFDDEFKRNNTLQSSGHGDDDDDDGGGSDIKLPFNTAEKFSDISPLGNDVDFYRFEAKAGDILALETVPGLQTMDTVIGLFDARTGALLIADDDGGVGLLSRLLVQVTASGTYAVAVSTFPDLTFTGAGEDSGRYVLNVQKYRGTIRPLLDDDSAAVPLTTFAFPFNGTNYSSVFVNGNGNLTFGVSNADFSESVPELLSGPPRIAPLWDDLFPGQGLVITEEKDKALYVHFVSVPEFLVTGTNYFTVVLDRSGEVNFEYGPTNRSDALIGLTKGGGVTDPGPTDLSEANKLNATGTTYQLFGPPASFAAYGGCDLSFSDLRFKK